MKWLQATDHQGKPCQYNYLTGEVSYPTSESENNTQPSSSISKKPCRDCNGLGKYYGLLEVKDCMTCEGTGEVNG